MVSTLDDNKRLSIALTLLANMKALQNLLINNEQQFIQDCTDDDIRVDTEWLVIRHRLQISKGLALQLPASSYFR